MRASLLFIWIVVNRRSFINKFFLWQSPNFVLRVRMCECVCVAFIIIILQRRKNRFGAIHCDCSNANTEIDPMADSLQEMAQCQPTKRHMWILFQFTVKATTLHRVASKCTKILIECIDFIRIWTWTMNNGHQATTNEMKEERDNRKYDTTTNWNQMLNYTNKFAKLNWNILLRNVRRSQLRRLQIKSQKLKQYMYIHCTLYTQELYSFALVSRLELL